ncbi:MAG: GH3 auxin-responsive promoter family protein [Paracoccaceae bacterium]
MSLGLAARAALEVADLFYRRRLLADARDPRRAQDRALRRILRANAGTGFGRAHGFGGLTSRDAYRAAVPVQTHESLADAIRRQAESGAPALTVAPPIFYARTSGTTGPARDFPVTAGSQAAQRAAQRVFAATLHRGTGFFEGRIAGFGGAHVEGRLAGGQPFGSASGQTYATAPAFVRRKFVVPEAVFAIADAREKYHAYALAALAAHDLSGIITANPSTLLSMVTHVQRNAEAVLRDLAQGAARPDRAKLLEAALVQGLSLDHVWPRLGTLATWTGGNCRVALDQLAPLLPPRLKVVEIGYRASEFIGTINVDAATNTCLPDLRHTVFEFVEEDLWERGEAAFLWLDEIEAGRRYYVFATTASGLYRYHINDVVEMTGRVGACPALVFVRKGQGATSITGEKLTETQAMAAAQAIGVAPAFFIAVADPQAARYRLFHEIDAPPPADRAAKAAAAFDAALCAGNIEYAAKRSSGRLSPAEVVFVRPGAGEAVKAAAVAAGQREAQVKPPLLADAGRWRFDFGPYRWDGGE